MDIKTKFSIGESIYFLQGNKVTIGEILSINIIVENYTTIKYKIEFKSSIGLTNFRTRYVLETNAFRNQDELLNSIKI